MAAIGASSLRSRLYTFALAFAAVGTGAAGVTAGLGVPSVATAAPAAPASAARASGVPAPTPAAAPASALTASPARFLATGQLPHGTRLGSWRAGPRRAGLPAPEAFCLDGALPADETAHVGYRGAPQVSAEEYLTVLDGEARAADLVGALRARIEGCHREWLDRDIPAYGEAHRRAKWQRYGTSPIADGLTTFGVFTVPPDGAAATHLYAVGRDGAAVVTLYLALPGKRAHAPVEEFSASAAKALRRAP